MSSFAQLLLLISACSLALYNYLDNLNDLTRLRLALPQLQQSLSQQLVEMQQLRDQWARTSSVHALYNLAQQSDFRHLRHYRIPQSCPATRADPSCNDQERSPNALVKPSCR